ncbi:hypothetical protein TNCV_502001 [Trichonephila clavipes]|nr:hypothetical protein TNCV_502001 [Trichonephila clavipes]
MAAPIEKSEPAKNSSSKSDSNKKEENTSPKDLFRHGRISQILPGFSGHLRCRKGLQKMRKPAKIASTSFSGYWPLKAKA